MKRLATAAVLIPVVVYVVVFAPEWLFLLVLAAAAILSYREYDGIAAAILTTFRPRNPGTSLRRAGLLLGGVLYIFGCWWCAIPLRETNQHWLMFALLVNWAGDSGAYYIGKNFGRHKLAPKVSPKKTWEGAAASVVASVFLAGGYLIATIHSLPWWHAAAIAILANIAGQFGDLAESALKRRASVKDSGTLLPGHGGFLDRVDSTLFALPVVFAYVRLAL